MRRRAQTIRDAHAATFRRLPGMLRWSLIVTVVFFFSGTAHAQSGVITTVVGPQLNDSSIAYASLSLPSGVAVDSSTSAPAIYTADAYNCVVWKTQGGQSAVFAGILATSAGSCSSGAATTVPTTTPLQYPVSVALCNGNLFIASNGYDPFVFDSSAQTGGTFDEVDSTGALSALPLPGTGGEGGGPLHPVAIACDASGNVYVASYFYLTQDSGFFGQVNQFSPKTGGGWTVGEPVSGLFDQAYTSLAFNPSDNNLYGILAGQVGEGWLGTPLLSVGSIQNITQGTPGLSGGDSFNNPDALAFDASGNIYISEAAGLDQYTSYVELVSSNGNKTVIAGNGTPGYFGDGGLGTNAEVNGVDQMVFDSFGDLYLADAQNQRIRRIHPLATGPSGLTLAHISVPQSSGGSAGSLQATLNPSGSVNDFYYVSGTNLVNVVSTGASVVSPGFERIVATIAVGQGGAGSASNLTLVADPTRNLIYVNNAADGKLYVIDGSYANATSHTVVGSVALDNAGATLLAIDTGLNEIYVAGPNATQVTAVRGGASPALIGNAGFPAALVSSLTVDPASHIVYAASDTGAGTGQEEALITMTPNPTTGVLTATNSVFPIDEDVLQPAFIPNSLAFDPPTGDLIASGAASIDTEFTQTYDAYDIFQFTPNYIEAPVPLNWPPITTTLDIPNRTFYLTDFDGSILDASSHAQMVTGMDTVFVDNNTLTSVSIPVFGTGTAPTTPHVYSIAPDTSSFQAWLSASDSSGGFVELWDSTTQTIAATLAIPNGGGGQLFVNSTNHSGYLLDEVNGVLWLINTPQWTNTAPPTFTPAQNGQSVTISATNAGDVVFYTLDGTPPGLGSTACNASCVVNLTQGLFTTINAIEVATVSGTQYASNVAQGVFTAPAPTSVSLTFAPSPGTTGASITATANLTVAPAVASVSGTVTFTAALSGSTSTLCSAVAVENNAGSWQATCTFTEATVGSYTITAAFSGDSLNEPSSNEAVLQINQGTTPILATVGGVSDPIAINSNNSPSLTYNAVLNNDSSVSLVQNGSPLSNQGCPAYSAVSGSTLSAGAIYVDAVNSRIYLAFIGGGTLYASYESISAQGSCTQGPLLPLTTNPNAQVALNADPVQGNVYVQNSYGAFPDVLYIFPTAPWSASSLPTPATVNLDYSATYGPIEIDPSNHQVYINDLGDAAYGAAGTYATSGFFVYDPNHSATAASNLQHVVGYSSGSTITQFNVGTLLDNGSGKLILVNENPKSTTANLTVPITILDTTKFSFFTNTSEPNSYNNDVDITPGAGLSTISATAQYSALGGADINAAAGLVYTYAFNANEEMQPGMLLEYNLSPSASPQETVLSNSMAMPAIYDSTGPWSVLNYDPESTEVVLSINAGGSGALGVTSPLCAGSPTLTQLVGNITSFSPLDYPVVNDPSGYVYAVQPASFAYPPAPAALDYVAPPPSTCGTAPPLQISPAALPSGIVGGSYAQTLTATGGSGSGYQFTVRSGTAFSAVGLTLSSGGAITGTPTKAEVAAPVTVTVTDSQSNTASQAYQVTIYPMLAISPATLPNGIVGGAYSQTLSATGGSRTGYTWSVTSGEASLTDLGLTFSAAGKLTGPPTFAGSASITVQVIDSAGDAATANYHITIYPALAVSPATLPAGIVGGNYSQTLTATGGSGSGYSWSVTAGTAFSAVGLVLSPSGAISGTPTSSETAAPVTVRVTDGQGDATTRTYQLTIDPLLAIGPATLPNGFTGTPYSVTLTATGGSGAGYSWSIIAGASSFSALNLSLSPIGAITGTPKQAGSAQFTVQVRDSLGDTATMNYQITVISNTPVNIVDNEAITVSDGSPQVLLLDVSDPNEVITVNDMYTVTATTLTTLHLTGPATTPPGQPATFVATVSATSGTAIPGGSVNFTATGGLTQSVALGSSGTAAWTTSSLPPGTDTVTAVYPGVTGFAAAGPMTLAVQVLDAPTVTTLTASAPNEPQGHPVTFTAAVTSPAAGTPTGTVTFYSGTIPLGTVPFSGAPVSITTSALPPGDNAITAVYSGDTDFLGSTSTSLVELTTTFKLSFESDGVIHLFPGQSVTLILVVSSVYGDYPYPINVNVAGLPQGATAVFSVESVTPGSSTVTAKLTITLPVLGAQASPAPRMREAAPALFALLLPLTFLYRRRRQWRFFLAAAMAVMALAGATGLIGCGSGGFFNQPPQTYNLTVSGTSGTATQSTDLTLIVE